MTTQNYVIRMYRKKPLFYGWLLLDSNKRPSVGSASNGHLILRFSTKEAARQYIIDNKLKAHKFKWQCTILPETNLMADADYPATPIEKEMFCIVDANGFNMFHDVAKNMFFFADKEVGYIAFDSLENAQNFVDQTKFEFPVTIKTLKPETPKLSIA